jgi:hypothetical protein
MFVFERAYRVFDCRCVIVEEGCDGRAENVVRLGNDWQVGRGACFCAGTAARGREKRVDDRI